MLPSLGSLSFLLQQQLGAPPLPSAVLGRASPLLLSQYRKQTVKCMDSGAIFPGAEAQLQHFLALVPRASHFTSL